MQAAIDRLENGVTLDLQKLGQMVELLRGSGQLLIGAVQLRLQLVEFQRLLLQVFASLVPLCFQRRDDVVAFGNRLGDLGLQRSVVGAKLCHVGLQAEDFSAQMGFRRACAAGNDVELAAIRGQFTGCGHGAGAGMIGKQIKEIIGQPVNCRNGCDGLTAAMHGAALEPGQDCPGSVIRQVDRCDLRHAIERLCGPSDPVRKQDQHPRQALGAL